MIRSFAVAASIALTSFAACGRPSDKPSSAVHADATHVPITVTSAGFEPGKVTVQKGVATTLIFTRTSDETCARSVVIDTGAQKIERDLPLDQPVEIAATFPTTGDLQYTCGMNMATGVISVR